MQTHRLAVSTPASLRRTSTPSLLAAFCLLGVSSVSAATLNWDPALTPTTPSGGSGASSTTSANWSNGTTDQNYASADTLVFGTTGGTVTTPGITITGVSITANNYTINSTSGEFQVSGSLSIGAGVSGTAINVSSGYFRLNTSSGGTVTFTNTDLVNFGSTVFGFSDNGRSVDITNSTGTGVTTFAALAVSRQATVSTGSTIKGSGNVTINSLGGQVSVTTFGVQNSANNPALSYTGTGIITIGGNNTTFNNAGTGTLSFNLNNASATLRLASDNALGARDASNALTDTVLLLNAGTVEASGGARSIENTVTVAGNATIGGSNNLTLSGNATIASGKTLTVSNTGVTALAGTNTFTGGTLAVNSGAKLRINGTSTGGTYTINSGATLGGTGTIDLSATNGSVNIGNGAFLAASSLDSLAFTLGTGTLDISGAVTNAAPSLLFGLGSPGSTVVSSSSATIGSGVLEFSDFTFTQDTGFGAGTYTLLTSVVGTLGSSLTGVVGGLDGTLSISSNNLILTLTDASSVPEPSSYAMFAGVAALCGVVLRRRR
jgi:hypothetical protein